MWTKKDCARQQKLAKTVKRYPSDLTDKEWALVRPLLPPASGEGRRRKTDLREIINALRYLIRSGCSWRMLPQEFGPWQTVYWWFRRLMRRFLFATILDICTMLDRHRQKKTLAPSLAVLDSQSRAPSRHRKRQNVPAWPALHSAFVRNHSRNIVHNMSIKCTHMERYNAAISQND